MKRAILLSHLFVREGEGYKLDVIDLCVDHFRKNNPDTYIFLSGHGLTPLSSTLDNSNGYYWPNEIIESEINVGHPRLVNEGLDCLIELGFEYVCKARIDSIHLIPNITEYCHNIITKENTKKLVTTCNDHGYMGDLFTYGDVNFIKKCWNEKTWYPTTTGLLSLGKNFINTVGGLNEKSWLELLKKHCSYRDPETLKWVNLRAYYRQILSLPRDKVLNNDFDFKDYIWDDWPLENRYTENNYYN